MRLYFFFITFVVSTIWFLPNLVSATDIPTYTPPTVNAAQWSLGQVTEILDQGTTTDPYSGGTFPYQIVQVKITDGTGVGQIVVIHYGGDLAIQQSQTVAVGETVVLNQSTDLDGQPVYSIVDKYRLPAAGIIALIFFIVVIIFGRSRGLFAIIGLALTITLLTQWIMPHILSGHNPFLVSITGATAIILISLYLAHGFTKRTTIAVISSLIMLAVGVLLAWLYTFFTHLSGAGSEEALTLQVGLFPHLNLTALLLGGMILGVIGVLDDITTGQAAAVEELHLANTALPFKELYRRGFSIGREHIASLVNTLVLAYAGAALPLLLLFYTNTTQPFWVILNSESVMEEIMRTLVGSTALVFAVPITTVLAAYVYSRKHS